MRRTRCAILSGLLVSVGVLTAAVGASASANPRPVLMFTSEVHGGWDVVTLYSDGSVSEPLNGVSDGEFPTFSPDGERVAFIGWTRVGSQWVGGGQIYVTDLATGTQELVHSAHDADIWWLKWSPKGDQIMFGSYPHKKVGEPERNSDVRVVTEIQPGVWVEGPLLTRPGNEQFPTWSPDGESVVYHYDPDKNGVHDKGESRAAAITVWKAGTSEHRRLTTLSENASMPVYSPDGRWIAYADYPPGPGGDRIRLMRPDGSQKRTIASDRSGPWALDFSSDGRYLAWGEGEGWEATRIMQLDLGRRGRISVLVDTPGIDHMPEYFPVP